jgi:BirA family biotin operon repressor/biotin-[acetyl-CoA-carboxylase] ligase
MSINNVKLPDGWKQIAFDVIDSTNIYAVDALKKGKIGEKCVVTANSQTQGHGRLGRTWVSEQGNLYTSITLKADEKRLQELGQLSFVSSLSLAEVINDFNKDAWVECKWPNDVLIDGKKTAGILLEVVEKDEERFVVIGTGVNIKNSPKDVNFYKTTCLSYENIAVNRERLLEKYIEHFNYNLDIWQKAGFEPIRECWLQYAKGIGENIKVSLRTMDFEGKFKNMAEDGAIMLELEDGTVKKIVSGEVFFC